MHRFILRSEAKRLRGIALLAYKEKVAKLIRGDVRCVLGTGAFGTMIVQRFRPQTLIQMIYPTLFKFLFTCTVRASVDEARL